MPSDYFDNYLFSLIRWLTKKKGLFSSCQLPDIVVALQILENDGTKRLLLPLFKVHHNIGFPICLLVVDNSSELLSFYTLKESGFIAHRIEINFSVNN